MSNDFKSSRSTVNVYTAVPDRTAKAFNMCTATRSTAFVISMAF